MSTEVEKVAAITAALESLIRRRDRLIYLKTSRGILVDKEDQLHLEKCEEAIATGKKVLKEMGIIFVE